MTKEQRRAVEKWVEALRSKEFKQGKSRLRSCNDEYCCLGVACRISSVPHEWKENITGHYACHIPANGESWSGTLPLSVETELGLTYEDQEILAEMNDTYSKTFPEIATWIEENILTREVTE